MIDKDHIIANLREVFDPEISINVYDLGLIYEVETCTAEYSVDITHTLTSAFCPFADEIISNIRQAGLVDNVRIVNVITTFEPPFTIDSVPEETRAIMGW
jgi:metal-sulfur cluster biosynthetic enzyme|tara:strand:+ start:757 stop:1056 length:300 start_codon:yes stop_codon:yes gene_type:complete